MLSGYMGAADIGHAILGAVAKVRAANRHALFCCDPVIGDVGRGVFVRPGIPEFMRDKAVPAADIVTPNHFELEWLTGRTIGTRAEARAAVAALRATGPKTVLTTSLITAETPADAIDLLAVGPDGAFLVRVPRLDVAVNGAGDAIAALFFVHAATTGSTAVALSRAASSIHGLLARTAAAGSREILTVEAQDEFVTPSRVFEAGRDRVIPGPLRERPSTASLPRRPRTGDRSMPLSFRRLAVVAGRLGRPRRPRARHRRAALAPRDLAHRHANIGGFARTDYVNPNAPKGGVVRLSFDGTFDSFNGTLPRGTVAPVETYLLMPLFDDSLDEISKLRGDRGGRLASRGLLVCHLPPEPTGALARRAPDHGRGRDLDDGDRAQERPAPAFYYRNIVKVEQTAEREVTFTFDAPGNREKPFIVGQLRIMPKHWWEGTDAQGRRRDVTQTTLEPRSAPAPTASARFSPGRSVGLERVQDWWGATLPIYVGKHNFDEVRIEFFRDDTGNWRRSRPTRSTSGRRTSPGSGTRPMISPRPATAASSARPSTTGLHGHAGGDPQPAPREVPGRPGAPAR